MKRLPRWLRIALLILVPILLLAWIVPYFLDVDHYRPQIIAAIEKETGRKAGIGKIRARLIPSLGFVVEDVSLGNPPGFAEGNFVSIEAMKGSLAWGPLILQKEFQLKALELVNPKIMLLEDDRGQTNYDFSNIPKPAKASAPSNFRVADVDSIRLRGVEVTMAEVAGRRRAPVPVLKASKLNVDLSDIALDIKKIKQWRAEVDLDGAEMKLAGLKGVIEFKSGTFTLRDGKAESTYKAQLGRGTSIKGTLRVDDIEHAIAVFEASTALLDVDQLMDEKAPPSSTPPPAGKSELVARGRISAEKIRFAPYEGTQAVAELRLFTDRIEVWPVQMGAYGGTVQVSAKVDRRQVPQRFSANIQADNVDVARLAAASPDTRGKITGTAKLALQAFGSLGSNPLNSLTGTGNFSVSNGRLPGVNLGKSIALLTKMEKIMTLGQGSSVPSDISFTSIAGDIAPGGGRVASNKIHVDANLGTVDLRGSCGFDQTLDYNGQAVLAQTASSGSKDNPIGAITGVFGGVMKQTVGRAPLPFTITGTFQNPKVTPRAGIPGFPIGGSKQAAQQQPLDEQPQQKKSIFDMFKKKKN